MTPLQIATLIVNASGKHERPADNIIQYMEQPFATGRWWPTEAGLNIIRSLGK